MTRVKRQERLLAYFDKLLRGNFENCTEDERVAILQEGLDLIEELKKPLRTMRDIVDEQASSVDTSGVLVPDQIRTSIENDIAIVREMVETQRAEVENFYKTAGLVVKVGMSLITFLV